MYNLCISLLVLELMLCSGPGHVYEMLGGGLPEPGVNMGPIPSGRKSDLQQLMESTRGQFAFLTGLRIQDSVGSVDPDPYSESGSRKAKMTNKKNKKFHVLKCWMFSFES